MIVSATNPTPGAPAYFSTDGELTPTSSANTTQIGRFVTSKDADGYARVDINIT
jgi:hypothetical protein